MVDPGTPDFGFTIREKNLVWADNIAELYEQGKAGQWDATTDIPWHDLPVLPDDLEQAVCQVMTFLIQNEYLAMYLPAKFMNRIDPQYSEVVLFLATQVMDEARHAEVFTKRALANGGGTPVRLGRDRMVPCAVCWRRTTTRMVPSLCTSLEKGLSWNC